MINLEAVLTDPLVAIIGVFVMAILELAKIYLPDNIEPKVLPIVAIVAGILLGFLSLMSIQGAVIGLLGGMSASGIYKVGSNMAKKAGSK